MANYPYQSTQGVGIQGVDIQGNTITPVSVTATAGVGNVTVAAYNPYEADSVIPTTSNVTVGAAAPTTTVHANAGVGNVTVAGYNATQVTSPVPGVANVTAAGLGVIATVSPAAGSANVAVAALAPTIGETTNVFPGIGNVVVAAYAPAVTQSNTVTPGVANVTVTAFSLFLTPTSPGYGYGTVPYGDANFNPTFVPVVTFPIPPIFDGTCIFEPPWVRDRAPYLPDSSQAEYNLWRHFENRLRGVNVWQRSDGTFCVDTPANYEAAQTHPAAYFSDDPIGPDLTAEEQGLADSNVNYPWNPIPPQPPFYDSTISEVPGAYVFATNWDQTTITEVLNPYLVTFWEGGSVNPITQAEALVLTAGGFGDCIE